MPYQTLHLGDKDDSTIMELEKIYNHIAKSKRIIAISGAGISCSSGIPDFRSKDGLFSQKRGTGMNAMPSKDLFDHSNLGTTEVLDEWLKFMVEMREMIGKAKVSRTHGFLWALHCKRKLQRIYTQNVDGLESRVGIPLVRPPSHKVTRGGCVPLHGSLVQLRCRRCSTIRFFCDTYLQSFQSGIAPTCPTCMDAVRRSSTPDQPPPRLRERPTGTLLPDVIMYNETHPQGEEISEMMAYDLKRKPDMLIIMGTTLCIASLKSVVRTFSEKVRSQGGLVVWISKEKPGDKRSEDVFDYVVLGDVETWSRDAVSRWCDLSPGDWNDGKGGASISGSYKLFEEVLVAGRTGAWEAQPQV